MLDYPKKSNDTIYYIAAFYHRIFSNLSKLIVVDADVEFKCDPVEIYDEFGRFLQEEVLGAAPELSPHYFQILHRLVDF